MWLLLLPFGLWVQSFDHEEFTPDPDLLVPLLSPLPPLLPYHLPSEGVGAWRWAGAHLSGQEWRPGAMRTGQAGGGLGGARTV